MSALPPIADIGEGVAECPLMTHSGHWEGWSRPTKLTFTSAHPKPAAPSALVCPPSNRPWRGRPRRFGKSVTFRCFKKILTISLITG